MPVIPIGLVGTDDVMPKDAKFPRLLGRIAVQRPVRKAARLLALRRQGTDRFVLRSVTDEIMYEIMQLSGQEYVDEYASRTATEPLPEPARSVEDDIDLSEEILVG